MANNLARQDFTSVQILEKLQAHPLVEESRHRTREIDQEYKQKHEERLRNRVKISDVLKYMAEKNGTAYIPPDVSKKKSPHKVVAVDHPLRYTDTGTTRPLSGKSSTSAEYVSMRLLSLLLDGLSRYFPPKLNPFDRYTPPHLALRSGGDIRYTLQRATLEL